LQPSKLTNKTFSKSPHWIGKSSTSMGISDIY
jgi:hypothetical protein